ncbi:MAG: T9SS type A sorting domain-containing protein [Candidatus Marithrix sp.]
MKIFQYSILLLLLMCINVLEAQTGASLYSFFIAGHTYGAPGVNNIGLHPPFKEKFGYIQNRTEIKFGVLTGDIVRPQPIAQDWDEVDADIDSLGLPVYFAVGNHDMENRPLFESRYGITYFSFIYENDLFIILDPNIDGWSILGPQLAFLEDVVYSNYESVDNIFVLFHQLLWWENNNIYQPFKPNSFFGINNPTNFWSHIEPLFNQLPNQVVFCAGDMGAASWSSDFVYDSYDNITIVGSGMGEGVGDNFVIINVNQDKSVNYDLICLNDSIIECFGELTDYQLSPDGNDEIYTFRSKIYPNPATNNFTIELDKDNNTIIQLFNISGYLVFEEQYHKIDKQNIDISSLQKGLYVIKVTSSLMQSTTKLVIQ